MLTQIALTLPLGCVNFAGRPSCGDGCARRDFTAGPASAGRAQPPDGAPIVASVSTARKQRTTFSFDQSTTHEKRPREIAPRPFRT
jgi:hypothetical protein